MLPTPFCSSTAFSHVRQRHQSLTPRLNTPEENDETMSTQHQTSNPDTLDSEGSVSTQDLFRALRLDEDQDRDPPQLPQSFYRSHASAYGHVYGGPTPFHSHADQSWTQSQQSQSASSSCCCYSGPPHHQHHRSLPSQLSHKEYTSCSEESCLSCHKSLDSLSSSHSSSMYSLEQPLSLRSIPPASDVGHHTLSPFFCSPQGAPCCAQCPAELFNRVNKPALPQYRPRARPMDLGDFRLPGPAYTHMSSNHGQVKKKTSHLSAPLSLEQRRVFVTYEADNERHLNEVINFVALLRHNGFDTHIDIFEQQFRSISKIDFMERYLSEKEYLIIIIISPKYYSTVTAPPEGHEQDERTFSTVYIHKQLQNEFIQNGSKNFRFIPILFPGAKRGHVPAWLQNTNIYSWPRDRDDILRRLMRVEKYNPPPIGDLPTIVSIPI